LLCPPRILHPGPTHIKPLGSIVVAKPSSIDVAHDFAVYREQTYGRCQTSQWVSLERAGAKVLTVQTAALPVTAAGSDGSVGWRASMTVRSPAFPTGEGSAYRDTRGFAIGRYEVFLTVMGQGPPPFSPSAEQRMLSLMLARAVAQPHS
jgi:hypothetical protein